MTIKATAAPAAAWAPSIARQAPAPRTMEASTNAKRDPVGLVHHALHAFVARPQAELEAHAQRRGEHGHAQSRRDEHQ